MSITSHSSETSNRPRNVDNNEHESTRHVSCHYIPRTQSKGLLLVREHCTLAAATRVALGLGCYIGHTRHSKDSTETNCVVLLTIQTGLCNLFLSISRSERRIKSCFLRHFSLSDGTSEHNHYACTLQVQICVRGEYRGLFF